MITLACVALVCAAVLYAWRDWLRVYAVRERTRQEAAERLSMRENLRHEREARQALELETRRVVIEEKRLAAEEKRAAQAPQRSPLPPDLAGRIMSWEDQWMQEQERATIMALYSELGDWDLVRQQLRPLSSYTNVEIAAPRDGLMS